MTNKPITCYKTCSAQADVAQAIQHNARYHGEETVDAPSPAQRLQNILDRAQAIVADIELDIAEWQQSTEPDAQQQVVGWLEEHTLATTALQKIEGGAKLLRILLQDRGTVAHTEISDGEEIREFLLIGVGDIIEATLQRLEAYIVEPSIASHDEEVEGAPPHEPVVFDSQLLIHQLPSSFSILIYARSMLEIGLAEAELISFEEAVAKANIPPKDQETTSHQLQLAAAIIQLMARKVYPAGLHPHYNTTKLYRDIYANHLERILALLIHWRIVPADFTFSS